MQTDNPNSIAQVSDPHADNTMLIDDLDTTRVEGDMDVLELKEKGMKGK